MLRTTSINNYYSLNNTSIEVPLTIRVPKNIKVFRAHIYCDNREDLTTSPTEAFISTQQPGPTNNAGRSLSGIFITSYIYNETSVPVAPSTSTGFTVINTNSVIFDRRGVGYMYDDFYVFGKGGISVIWEGIIEE